MRVSSSLVRSSAASSASQSKVRASFPSSRCFWRAVNNSDMEACGSGAASREKGLLRSEGKEYVVQDGDMIYFRFNV